MLDIDLETINEIIQILQDCRQWWNLGRQVGRMAVAARRRRRRTR